jgi:4'-phosphopantetheinyl transferase
MPLARREVSLAPGQPAALQWIEGDADDASRWALVDLRPASGYVGALAVEGAGWQLRCWHYSPEQFNAGAMLETRFGQQ